MATDPFRQEYKPLTEAQKALIWEIKMKASELHDLFGKHESSGVGGREIAVAKTNLEQSVMWAVKGITS